jgi:two-component system chemotaxis response regulator CheY
MAHDLTQGVIIVAEDSPPNRAILVHLLLKLGFTVVECKDGLAAFEEMKKLQEQKATVLAVLSDIMMPRMDGIELLKQVRAIEEWKSLPFVLVTAVSDKTHIMEAKDHSVNGYILKPVTVQRVLSKLQELFPQRTFPKVA